MTRMTIWTLMPKSGQRSRSRWWHIWVGIFTAWSLGCEQHQNSIANGVGCRLSEETIYIFADRG